MLNATIGRLACVVVLGLNAIACAGSTEVPTSARSSRGTTTTTSDATATKDGDTTSAATTDAAKTTTPTPATPRPTTATGTTGDPMEPPAKTIACDTATDSVTAAYNLALLRAPDAAGLSYFLLQIQAGTTKHEVLEALVGSPEFANARAGLDDSRFVTSLYMGFLGRAPEADGLAFWLGQLTNGVSRTAVALSFVRGNEFADPNGNPVYACFY